MRVLIVEDFVAFRRFVCSTLGTKPELQVVGEASDGREAVQKAEELKPDLILLDIGLPTLNGIDAARQIRKLSPRSKILFSSAYSDQCAVEAAFSVGGSGYLVKSDAAANLLPGIKAVAQGKQFVSGNLGEASEAICSAYATASQA